MLAKILSLGTGEGDELRKDKAARAELTSWYTLALSDLDSAEATCSDLQIVAAAAELRRTIKGDV